ncbi:hypothetical protein GCM10028820_00770 [Tessaracoccus terricola]
MNQIPNTFDGWVQLFETGRGITVPVHQDLLARRIRGNRWVTVLAAAVLVLTLVVLGWLVVTGSGRTATYVLTGALALVLAFAIRYLGRMRKRLAVAEIAPNYLKVDKRGFVVAGVLDVPWEATVGVVSVDLLTKPQPGRRKLGARLAQAAGAAQAGVMVGLNKGTAKSLRAAADPRVRILFDAFLDIGSIRVPLDAVLRADHVVAVLFAVCGAANVAGRESVLAQEPQQARTAVNKVMRSEPPISGLGVLDALAAGSATTASEAAPASEPSPQPSPPDDPSDGRRNRG